jgi:hypothetical protein
MHYGVYSICGRLLARTWNAIISDAQNVSDILYTESDSIGRLEERVLNTKTVVM